MPSASDAPWVENSAMKLPERPPMRTDPLASKGTNPGYPTTPPGSSDSGGKGLEAGLDQPVLCRAVLP